MFAVLESDPSAGEQTGVTLTICWLLLAVKYSSRKEKQLKVSGIVLVSGCVAAFVAEGESRGKGLAATPMMADGGTVGGGRRQQRRIKRLSPSALSASTPNVTARLVLTLSEATDLIEAQCQR